MTSRLDRIINPLSEAEEILDLLDSEAPPLAESLESQVFIDLPDGTIDPRLQYMSYSSNLTLHACPRKYQLYKLNALKNPYENEIVQGVTFAYGHVVGDGIQNVLARKTWAEILMAAFLMWEPALLDEDVKGNKSFFGALAAIKKFSALREQGFLDEYELMYYEGEPALELGFIIELPDGFKYRGFVDAVLRHRSTGQIVVLELKTTKNKAVNGAMYKNSAQQ